jgi:hypothetical protein
VKAHIALCQHDQGRPDPGKEIPVSMYGIHGEQNAAATHNSFDEVARAANKDIGQASKSVKRGKKLIGSLR